MSELIAAIILYGAIGLIIYLKRDKFEWLQGVIFAYRTKKPLKWMDKLRPKSYIWKVFSTICIPLGFYFMPQLVYLLADKAINILLNPGETAGVALAIPGVRIPGSPIYIPLFYGIISIAVLALVHEMAHGIIGKGEGISLKSSGFGMFLIFPLFFVEPDQESMKKTSRLSRLRMLSAGPGSNVILSFILLTLLSTTFMPFFTNNTVIEGVRITSLVPDYPAAKANITQGEIITGVNSERINNLTHFSSTLQNFSPGDELVINTKSNNYSLVATSNPNNESLAYIGVFLRDEVNYSARAKAVYGEFFLGLLRIIYDLLLWIGFLNLSVGVMNLLPIWGLDGSRMLYDLLTYVMSDKKARAVTSFLSSLCIGLLIINIAPVFINLFI